MDAFSDLKAFLRQRGISISYASQLFGINYNTLRNLLAGNRAALNAAALEQLQTRVQAYLDEVRHQEMLLYERMFPLISEVPTMITRQVLKTLSNDLDAL